VKETSDARSAAALRAEFDATFAAPPPAAAPDSVAVLSVRVGAEPAAIRVLETAGLLSARRIVPVPSRRPELLGVCGLRGTVLPVFGLARLLGAAASGEAPRWIVLAQGDERIGLALDDFEGHVVVPAAALRAAERDGRAHVAGAVRLGTETRALLSVPSLVRAITGT
jgi:chemotaxis signal transduction protein